MLNPEWTFGMQDLEYYTNGYLVNNLDRKTQQSFLRQMEEYT